MIDDLSPARECAVIGEAFVNLVCAENAHASLPRFVRRGESPKARMTRAFQTAVWVLHLCAVARNAFRAARDAPALSVRVAARCAAALAYGAGLVPAARLRRATVTGTIPFGRSRVC